MEIKKLLPLILLAWLTGILTVAVYLSRFAVEDFSVNDLIPFGISLFLFVTLLSTISFVVLRRFLSEKSGSFIVSIIAGISVFAVPVMIFAGVRAFVLKNLPVAEFSLFSAAHFNAGLAFGLFFCWFFKAQKYWTIILFLLPVITFTALLPNLLPFANEAFLASESNGKVFLTAQMSEPRSTHTATLLKNGKILITGGMISVIGDELPTASAEIYDPETNSFEKVGKMSVARAGHTATLLKSGDVLISGGIDEKQPVSSAEIYRFESKEFVPVGSMQIARERHTATLLKNGNVLVIGGTIVKPGEQAEIYDFQMQTFRQIAPMNAKRAAQTATALRDGRVFIAGGAESLNSVLSSIEIFNPETETFQIAGRMQANRYKHSAVLLTNDKVLLLGGADERDWTGRRNSVEIYDLAKNASQIVGSLNRARFKFPNAVALSTAGKIVAAGSGRRVEIFDASTGNFLVGAGSLGGEWFYATATPLPDGRIFISGGYNSSLISTDQTWIFQPN